MHGTLALIAAETKRACGPAARRSSPGSPTSSSSRRSAAWIETDPSAQTGWLGALRDQQIGRALSLIHGDPARAWTVAALADELAMSRSAFAARFTELVGEPVMQLRDPLAHAGGGQRAARRGRHGGRAGEPARLSLRGRVRRAFKRVIGVAPGPDQAQRRAGHRAMALPAAA